MHTHTNPGKLFQLETPKLPSPPSWAESVLRVAFVAMYIHSVEKLAKP